VSGLVLVLLGLVALTLLLHVVAWLVRLPLASRLLGDLPWLPAHCGGPVDDGESVAFLTADGVRLQGTYLPTTLRRRRGVVAFCHELNGDRWSALVAGAELRRHGFDLFTFDFRNHGTSQRVVGYEPAPWATRHELADVYAAIDYLAGRADADPRGVGLVGFGRGATAAVCAAARQRRVRAVVADGLLPLERIQAVRLRRHLRRWLGPIHQLVPQRVFEWMAAAARAIACWQAASPMLSVDRAARRLRCPTLLVCGGQDPHVPPEAIEQLREQTAGRTGLWLVPEAGHVRAVSARPHAYTRRLARFFIRHLAEPASVEARHDRPRRARAKTLVASAAPLVLGPLLPALNGHAAHAPRHAK
jgi:pimeloyl-ACP methyl ester carboxylesterase